MVHVGGEQEAAHLEAQRDFGDAGTCGYDNGLGSKPLRPLHVPGVPAEAQFDDGVAFVPHVAQADDVLPPLAPVLRVELLHLLFHGYVLGSGQPVLGLLTSRLAAQHGPEVRLPVPQLLGLTEPFGGVHHLQAALAVRPLVEERGKARREAADASLDPGLLRVREDHAPVAQGRGLRQVLKQSVAPCLHGLLLFRGHRIVAQLAETPPLKDLRRGEQSVVPVEEDNCLRGLCEPPVRRQRSKRVGARQRS
mmetsp:Transcript_108867/g.303551  ORF Transcript_108867/g.303551 Transcript_108867/m.303551 type:complete len:250 (-) Transcript_108867:405-1154(-)